MPSPLIGLLCLLSLSGCAVYRPLPLDPVAELQHIELRSFETVDLENGIEEQDGHFPIAQTVSLQEGLSLSEANLLALFYSPEILKAKSDCKIGDAVLLEAGFPNNPQIFLGPRLSTEDSSLIFPASLAFQFSLSDRRGPRRAAATWEREKSRWLLLETEIAVLAAIQKGFLRIEADRMHEEIVVRRADRAKELMLWVKSLYSSGEIDLFSFQIAQRGHEDAKSELMNTRLKRRRSERELLKLVGLLPDSEIELLFCPLPLLHLEIEDLEPNEILSHPALKAIEVEYCAAEQTLRAEVASQFPTLHIGPELESDRGEMTIGIGLGFEIPIFTRNRTGIAIAEENRNRIRNHYHEMLLGLWEKRVNLQDEFQALKDRAKDLQDIALIDAEKLDEIFSDSFQSNDDGVLKALGAADSVARTLGEEVELQRRIGEVKIDLLLTSAALLPGNCLDHESTGGDDDG